MQNSRITIMGRCAMGAAGVAITLQANDTASIQHPRRILSHTEVNQKQYDGKEGSTKERVDYGANQM